VTGAGAFGILSSHGTIGESTTGSDSILPALFLQTDAQLSIL
jgi:hypothetical protein